jgi:hypothetical protein
MLVLDIPSALDEEAGSGAGRLYKYSMILRITTVLVPLRLNTSLDGRERGV